MISYLEIGLLLLAAIAALGVAANRLRLPASILLVIAGAGLAMIPGLPRIELEPVLILLLVLPPVIYSAGVSMSWREFRFNLRPIALLAIGAVVFTSCAVAASVHWLLGWPWAVGFVLGAIVAPPDVVAPLAIARRLGARAAGRFRRTGDRRRGPLRELERAATHFGGDAPAGRLRLGSGNLHGRLLLRHDDRLDLWHVMKSVPE
jgi:NhaP-type Na+/H+ or K+/H+ antiporter